jgi:hypothetical protein
MAICICGNKIDDEHFTCERRCSSSEVWWCEECGAIAIVHDYEIPQPEEFIRPLLTHDHGG